MLNPKYCSGLFVALCCGFASGALAQQPQVLVHCQVVDDISAQPLSRVRVKLSGGKLPEPLIGSSDDRGGCVIPPVEPGRYSMTLQKTGYFPRADGDPAGYPAVEVAADTAGDFDSGTIILTKIRSISGRIKWQDGEPADHVIGHALVVRRNRAEFRPGDALLAMTDERGEFRIGNLRPGRYVVYGYTIGFAAEDRHTPVSLPVFYPGTTTPDVNSAVDLRGVSEVGGISLTLQETVGVSVGGYVEPSAVLAAGNPVQVGLMIPGSPAQPFAATRTNVGVPFRLSNIPVGLYNVITISTKYPNVRSVQALRVDGPVTDLRVSMGELQTLTGNARYENDKAVGPDPGKGPAVSGPGSPPLPPTEVVSGISLWFACSDLQMFGNVLTRTDKGGAIKLDVFPDQAFRLTVATPPGVWVSQVLQQGKELDGAPFPVESGGGPLEILLRRDVGSVAGAVHDKDGNPVHAFVVVAPNSRKREHLFRTAWTGSDGKFNLTNVATGDYMVFALDRNEEESYLDSGYLDHFKSKASTVSVGADAANSVSLSVVAATPPL